MLGSTDIIAFRPICCLHCEPVSKEKQRFGPFLGNEEDLRGTKKAKIAPKFWCTFLGAILLEMGFFCQNVGSRSV